MKVKFFDKLVPNSLSKHLRRWRYDRRYKRKFKQLHGYDLNVISPQTYAEKIFYRKFNGNFKEMSNFSDKYKVREYIENKIGKQFLIPLLGVYDHLTLGDLVDLPNQFVVKTNHGSGKKHIEIVHDKSSHDLEGLVKKMNYALTLDFGYDRRELWYTKIDKKILIEEHLIPNGDAPDDYKCHCFSNNEIFIAVDRDRSQGHKRSVFDENWALTDISLSSFPSIGTCDEPKNFDLMKSLALTLSEDFDYVRVDFYNLNGKIFFGELTFAPANGMGILEPKQYADLWGELWKLDIKNEALYTQ